MKRFNSILLIFAAGVLLILSQACGFSQQNNASTALSWEQVKAKFEAANPALRADAFGVDEMKAAETTAFLRPNPTVGLSTDGFADCTAQRSRTGNALAALDRHAVGSQHRLPARARAQARICACRARRKGRRLPSPSTSIWSAICSSICARPLWIRLKPKAVLELAKADLAYYDNIIKISRDRFHAGDIAQIDLDRIELLRVQYEVEIQIGHRQSAHRQNSTSATAERTHAGGTVRCDRSVRFC